MFRSFRILELAFVMTACLGFFAHAKAAEIIEGCSGEGCGCVVQRALEREITLYAQMDGSSLRS
jgi:hypothetical protein